MGNDRFRGDQMPLPQQGGGDDDEGGGGGINMVVVRDQLSYALRAIARRKGVVASVFVAIVALAVVGLVTLPKTYHVESRLFSKSDAAVGSRPDWNDPIKGAADIILRHDNLLLLTKETDLVQRWKTHRAPALRLKDKVQAMLGKTSSPEDHLQAMVGLLKTRLSVASGEGALTIGVDWSDPESAMQIVDAAQQNFLEQRHLLEVSTIAESTSILEGHAATLRKEIETIAGELRKETQDAAPARPSAPAPSTPAASGTPAPARRAPRPAVKRRPEADADLARLKSLIDAKQRAVSDLEDFRQRRLLDLQAKLAEQQTKYTDEHPVVVDIKQNIASVSKDSPQLTSLRAELKDLQDTYQAKSGGPDVESGAAPLTGAWHPESAATQANSVLPSELTQILQRETQEERDPAMFTQLKYAMSKYSELRAQISAAGVNLDLAQASFKYRYSVVVPPELPTGPIKPKVPMMMALAVAVGLLFGILAAVALEFKRGRVVQIWQIERLLAIPVIGELTPGDRAPPSNQPG